ncbi:unnamed protein product [Adineta steineri]|uniref:Uncharacterized protein n=1 Tax=Adineta steineri TaxID=433720 RepID=A0A814WLJ6_9BILA|nr:unnamed protein product [Adineta steineri]
MGNIRFTIVDLKHNLNEAGHILKNYFRICDRSRFGASKKKLYKLIQFQDISGKPFVILGTQIHLQTATIDEEPALNDEKLAPTHEEQLRTELDLDVKIIKTLFLSLKSFFSSEGNNKLLTLYAVNTKDIGTFACAFQFIRQYLKDA